jgi:peptidoglycan-associated lipoprotein
MEVHVMRAPRAVLAAALVLVTAAALGCKTKKPPETVPQPTRTPVATPAPTPTPEPTPAEPFPQQQVEKAPVTEPSVDELNRQGVLKTVHFAYDSNAIDDEARAVLQEDAAWLRAHPNHKVEIGGHCDERGSIGYNLALGDRRAQAVKDYLVSLGVDGSTLETVSYGKERPVDPGHNEAAWAKNRRAEFTIKS